MNNNQEKQNADNFLNETNAKLSAMIENIGDVIGIIGADGFIKYKTPNSEKWFGWKPEDLIGTNGWEKVHPEDIERLQKEYNAGIDKDNASVRVEYRYKCKDGTYTWIELTAVNRINDAVINGILLNYHDISIRKQAEEELKESEERFAALFQDAPLAYQSLETDGRILEVNNAWLIMLGYSSDEVIGKWFGDFLAPEFVDIFRKRFSIFKAVGKIHTEFKMLHKNGEQKSINFEGRIKHDKEGLFERAQCILQDVTEQMRVEVEQEKLKDQLNQIQKLDSIGVLAGGIAHDFNNILTGIFGYIELALEESTEEKTKTYLAQSLSSLERARALSKQLLTFAKGGAPIKKVENLFPFIQETV